jgi:hypothetical protein
MFKLVSERKNGKHIGSFILMAKEATPFYIA